LIAFDRIHEEDDPITAEIVLLDRISGKERPLYQHEVNPIAIYPSPDGTRLLVQIGDTDVVFRYVGIDLDTRGVEEFPEIDGHVLYGPSGSRWRVATAMNNITNEAISATGYFAVDLNEGSLTKLAPITLDTGVVVTPPIFSDDGTAAMSAVFGPDQNALWHLDLDTATGTLITSAAIAGASISPDGCWVVMAAVPEGGDFSEAAITIVRPGQDEATEIGPGRIPVWTAG
jgi:hypothetical protein